MKKTLVVIAVAMLIAVGSVAPVLASTGTAEACDGLSPGYWKNHTKTWDGSHPNWDQTDPEWGHRAPRPGDRFCCWFGVGPEATLLEVLNTRGGKFDSLNRAAVAALLNSFYHDAEADSWDYYSVYGVRTRVQDAYNGVTSWQSVKADFEKTWD
jgi:hypothetical protein